MGPSALPRAALFETLRDPVGWLGAAFPLFRGSRLTAALPFSFQRLGFFCCCLVYCFIVPLLMSPTRRSLVAEEEVAPLLLRGFLESQTRIKHLVDVLPGVPFCEKEGPVAGPGIFGYLRPPETLLPLFQVILGNLKLDGLEECREAH